jgi:hypothetical protein
MRTEESGEFSVMVENSEVMASGVRETVFKQLAGTGVLFDSGRSSVHLGPDARTAYVGGLCGLVRIHSTY